MQPKEVERFCEHLHIRNYAANTVESYKIDLRLFFAHTDKPPEEVSWREIDRFVQHQHRQHLAATTINRRLNAIKHFFDFLVIEAELLSANPVKPSHYLREGKPLPKKLTQQQVKRLFAAITNSMDRALFLLMLRCGLRVSEVAHLKVSDIDWEQKALLVEQVKGGRIAGSISLLMLWRVCVNACRGDHRLCRAITFSGIRSARAIHCQ